MDGSDFLPISASPEFRGALGNHAFLISLAFPDSRAKRFGLGLELAKQASRYERQDISGTTWHFASFSHRAEQTRKASMAMDCLSSIKGLMIFVNGRQMRWNTAFRDTLRCYLRGCDAEKTEDWCHLHRNSRTPEFRIIQIRVPGQIGVQPPAKKTITWTVQCQRLGPQTEHAMSMSTERFCEILIAEAGRRESDWCPLFDPRAAMISEEWE